MTPVPLNRYTIRELPITCSNECVTEGTTPAEGDGSGSFVGAGSTLGGLEPVLLGFFEARKINLRCHHDAIPDLPVSGGYRTKFGDDGEISFSLQPGLYAVMGADGDSSY